MKRLIERRKIIILLLSINLFTLESLRKTAIQATEESDTNSKRPEVENSLVGQDSQEANLLDIADAKQSNRSVLETIEELEQLTKYLYEPVTRTGEMHYDEWKELMDKVTGGITFVNELMKYRALAHLALGYIKAAKSVLDVRSSQNYYSQASQREEKKTIDNYKQKHQLLTQGITNFRTAHFS